MGTRSKIGLYGILVLLLGSEVALAGEGTTDEPKRERTTDGSLDDVSGLSPVASLPVQAPSEEQVAAHGMFQGTTQELKRGLTLVSDAQSDAVARHTSMLPVGERGKSLAIQAISVSRGRTDVVIPQDAGGGAMLQTSRQVQLIGTEGRISMLVTDDKTVMVSFTAEALVGLSGRFKPLQPGVMRIVDHASNSVEDVPLAAPLQGLATQGLPLALGGNSTVGLRASRSGTTPSGVRYRAYLVDHRGELVGRLHESDKLESLQVGTPKPGHFWATVRVINEWGYAGAPSKPTHVSVLGIDEGSATVRDDIVYLAPGERVPLYGQDGLIMRYGTSPLFVPAPETLGLPGKRATTVEFRDPDDQRSYAVIQLAPKVLKTRIEIGPATSTWPRDPVEINVRMWDGHGQSFDWTEDYTVVTRVGLREVDIDWKKNTGVLSGQLAPQDGPGPWVVRVSLFDSLGREVERDFLEVSKTEEPPPLVLGSGETLAQR